MKKFTLTIAICLAMFSLFGQSDSAEVHEKAPASIIKDTPLLIIDSVIVSMDSIKNINPNDIADVTVLKEKTRLAVYGERGRKGVIIAETKPFARKKYIHFLRLSSKGYDSLYRQIGSDSSFQYILNGKVLTQNYEGSLASLSLQKLTDIQILNKQQLKDSFDIDDKDYGVAIISENKNAAKDAH